ncbi:BTB/POZ domain protein [Pyrenophora tritici-repentis]|nr:BTB/POZ domain protein [Pyrenophora tritici-repentis]
MDLDKPSNDNQEILVNIVPDGDSILVVGPDMVKLRVHFLFLREASKPFSAMFALKWKEGDAFFS